METMTAEDWVIWQAARRDSLAAFRRLNAELQTAVLANRPVAEVAELSIQANEAFKATGRVP